MEQNQIKEIRGELLKHGHSFASIAAGMDPPVSRQHVRDVVCGRAVSARVRAAVAAALGFDPWIESGRSPAA